MGDPAAPPPLDQDIDTPPDPVEDAGVPLAVEAARVGLASRVLEAQGALYDAPRRVIEGAKQVAEVATQGIETLTRGAGHVSEAAAAQARSARDLTTFLAKAIEEHKAQKPAPRTLEIVVEHGTKMVTTLGTKALEEVGPALRQLLGGLLGGATPRPARQAAPRPRPAGQAGPAPPADEDEAESMVLVLYKNLPAHVRQTMSLEEFIKSVEAAEAS